MLDSKIAEKLNYTSSNLSIYSFDENLMLILKARILLLYKFTNEKVRNLQFNSFPISLRKSRIGRTRPISVLTRNVQGQRTRSLPLNIQAEESLAFIARFARGLNSFSKISKNLSVRNKYAILRQEQLVGEEEAACSQIVKGLY